MSDLIRLDVPLLLPGVRDEQDECVARLIGLLEKRQGVESVHVLRRGAGVQDAAHARIAGAGAPLDQPQLCLHYDPDQLTLSQVTALATAAGAELRERYGHVVIPFRMVGSEDDGRRVEAGLLGLHGVTAASVNFAGQFARVEYDTTLVQYENVLSRLREMGARPERRLSRAVRRRWPADRATRSAAISPPVPAVPTSLTAERRTSPVSRTPLAQHGSWYARHRELAWSLIAGGFLLVARVAVEQQTAAALTLYVVSYFFGARDNVGHFLKDLRGGRFRFNIDLLMVVAAIGAAILGEWFEGALLLFLFSLGHAMEHYALGRARNAIAALSQLAPQRATVVHDGQERTVAIEEVRAGDRVVVKPAERIAVDGVVREGRSGVNQAPITGESVPVDKEPGTNVFAGSVNGDGALVIEVTGAVGDRTLDRVITLVAEASTQKAPTQKFTDRFERIFVPAVLVADVLVMLLPPLIGLWTWSESFYRAMALLVAASPCALALGTPAAVLTGIAQAARKGVLIKGGAHLEALGTIEVLALDKTGTLTTGEPTVTDVVPFDGVSEAQLLTTAAAVERRSQHPLARAVVHAAEGRGLALPEAGELEAISGKGIRSTLQGQRVEIGRLLLFEEMGAGVPDRVRQDVARLEADGRSTMTVRSTATDAAGKDDGWLGSLGIADEPRANTPDTLRRLREVGVRRIVMLTGDNAGVANAVARAVGISEVRASLLPEDKVTAIRELAAHGRVAMVGDGVNDAPALAHATVGIAMGGAGTAAALETADVALMGDDLARLPFAIGLSRAARRVIRQNLWISLGVIAMLVVVTIGGLARIGPTVIVHEGSTLVVILNALRLLRYDPR